MHYLTCEAEGFNLLIVWFRIYKTISKPPYELLKVDDLSSSLPSLQDIQTAYTRFKQLFLIGKWDFKAKHSNDVLCLLSAVIFLIGVLILRVVKTDFKICNWRLCLCLGCEWRFVFLWFNHLLLSYHVSENYFWRSGVLGVSWNTLAGMKFVGEIFQSSVASLPAFGLCLQ